MCIYTIESSVYLLHFVPVVKKEAFLTLLVLIQSFSNFGFSGNCKVVYAFDECIKREQHL